MSNISFITTDKSTFHCIATSLFVENWVYDLVRLSKSERQKVKQTINLFPDNLRCSSHSRPHALFRAGGKDPSQGQCQGQTRRKRGEDFNRHNLDLEIVNTREEGNGPQLSSLLCSVLASLE